MENLKMCLIPAPEPGMTTASTTALSHRFYRSIDAAGADWDAAAPADDIFLQRAYLSVLEHNPPKGMRLGYLVYYQHNRPVGVALCQIKYFKADENIQEISTPLPQSGSGCFFTAAAQWLKKQIAGWVAADVLICGNLLLTGEHGYYFHHSIPHQEAIKYLETSFVQLAKDLEKQNIRTPITLIKDIIPARTLENKHLESNGYIPFLVQPNMVLDLPFNSFEDYLNAMTTKYRTRAKRAFKKMEGVEKRELSTADVQRELPVMYRLYREIAKNAGFNMVDLNEKYLLALKRDFAPHYRVHGYYRDGQLIAFYTTICNYDALDAHFLGYEQTLNHDMQLYLNMLYDLVKAGIEAGCRQVVLARTALEIKSSIGAVPHDLCCYLRHHNPLTNRFTGTLLDYLNPVEKWEQRHPFKSNTVLQENE
jgi:predicted N-acyltransferase